MRKIHVRIVLDVMAVADDNICNPEDYVVEAIVENPPGQFGPVDIQDVQVTNYEVTDSR